MRKNRVYGRWAGEPVGTPEDKTRCVESVRDQFGPVSRQCTRNRGHGKNGEYCKQHAKKNP